MSKEKERKKELIRRKSDNRCFYCLREFTTWDDFGTDHKIPKSKGGTNDIENLVLACRKCNGLKGNYLIEDWKKIITILHESTSKELAHLTLIKNRLDEL